MLNKNYDVLKKYWAKMCLVVAMFLFLGNPMYAYAEEVIHSFNTIISVNTDNSIDVTEIIEYDSSAEERRGIYRDIYPYSSSGKEIDISNIVVTDERDVPYQWEQYNEGKYIRVKIGSPDVSFQGRKIYKIQYRASRAVAHFDSFDEIYWNTTGNNWPFSINKALALVELPAGGMIKQESCYFGVSGSTEMCEVMHASGTDIIATFGAPRVLLPGEGLTVALGFEKGLVSEYSKFENFVHYVSWIVGALLAIASLVRLVFRWLRYGKDPKGTQVIVPQYDVPDNLSPLEVAGIMDEGINAEDISSQIIHLAIHGYITIKAVERKILGIIPKSDYELILNKEFHNIPDADRELLQRLFSVSAVGATVRMNDLKNTFYTAIGAIDRIVMDTLEQGKYYRSVNFNVINVRNVIGAVAATVIVFIIGELGLILGVLSSIVIFLVSQSFTARTRKGVLTKEYILGLKDYLQIAEKDRLAFHNAPEKKPEVFEKLLPYAMVLGVEEKWAKEFEGIYTTPPTWYQDAYITHFGAMSLTEGLADFKVHATGVLDPTSGGSGSGGGGSSGGGGGGGGGGSW